MPPLFWSGKLSLPMKLLVEMNNILALFTGSANDTQEMKDRVKLGYEGKFSQHVQQYDELGYHLQDRSARYQLEGISLKDMHILDVGCGTGALTQVAFENGARGIICGDISAYKPRIKNLPEILNTRYASWMQKHFPIRMKLWMR